MTFRAWLRRLFSFFFRLQWKLTLTYTVVTVAVLSILLIVLMFTSNLMLYSTPQLTVMVAQALQGAAGELAPALSEEPPDTQVIQDWVSRTFQGNSVLINNEGADADYSLSFSSTASNTTILGVLDQSGRVLASNHPDRLAVGVVPSDEIPEMGLELIDRALSGEHKLSQLWLRGAGQQAVVAPVFSEQEEVLGVIVLILDQPNQLEMLWISLVSILPVILFLTVFAGLIGSAFGALTARGLTRRLKSATQATDAWGKGDFSVRIEDRQKDEIGQLARDMNRMADELQALMATRQELAAFEERNRLARDLHDSAKQQVFAISMNLAAAKKLWALNPEDARKRVEIAADLSRQSQQELTALIQTLRPVQLNRHHLTQALSDSVKSWDRQNGIAASFAVQGEERGLPQEVEQALFRMAQEALSNVARHSEATTVQLELTLAADAVTLRVKDNGHGFDTEQPARGLGLRSMQERLHAVGGNLQILSCPEGTHLLARVPLADSREGSE